MRFRSTGTAYSESRPYVSRRSSRYDDLQQESQSITINRAMAAARVVITSLIYYPFTAEPYKVIQKYDDTD